MNVIKQIKMDLGQRGITQRVSAKQGDVNTRVLKIGLCSNGTAWIVPTEVTAVVRYRKKDGTSGIYDTMPDGVTKAVTAEGSTLIVNLAPQVFTCPGIVRCDVVLTKETEILSTFDFEIDVGPSPVNDDMLESQDYYKVVSLEQINAVLEALEESLEEVSSNGISASGATENQVPTADGNGGWEWKDPQGGSGSGTAGKDGGYYTPSVDEAGNLSWTASEADMPAVSGANIKGPKGDTGETGPQGPKGETGPAGANGATPNIQIGTVTTLDAGSSATASISGTAENPLLNLGIPKGADGTPGSSGGGYTLPVASESELGGVKPVEATGEMTQLVGVDAEGLLFTAPGKGSSWELLNTITLEEDSNAVIISTDSDGNAFELSALMFYIDRVASDLQTEASTLYIGNAPNGYFGQMQGQAAAQTRIWFSAEFMTKHMWRSTGGNTANGQFVSSISYSGGCPTSATMLRLYGYYFGAGTKITFYGVRK